jgi:hypothetical protein
MTSSNGADSKDPQNDGVDKPKSQPVRALLSEWRFVVRIYRFLDRHHAHIPHYIIAILTILIVIFAWRAWEESRKTTEALQEQLNVLKEEQRPFIGEADPIEYPKFISEFGQIIWTYHFVNYGKGVAYDVQFQTYMKIGNEKYQPVMGAADKRSEKIDIPPTRSHFHTAVSRPGISEEYFKYIIQKEHSIGVLIEFVYWNAAHDRKFTNAICMETLASGAVTFRDPEECQK